LLGILRDYVERAVAMEEGLLARRRRASGATLIEGAPSSAARIAELIGR